MVDNQIKSYASRFGKYETVDTVEEKDMLKGELIELNTTKHPKPAESRRRRCNGCRPHGKSTERAVCQCKKGDTIIFNPQKLSITKWKYRH